MVDYNIYTTTTARVMVFSVGHENDFSSSCEFIAESATPATAYIALIKKLMGTHRIRTKSSAHVTSGVTTDATLKTYLETYQYEDSVTLLSQ